MKEFYYSDGDQQKGPFNLEEIKNQKISKNTMIWYIGLTNWIEASQVDELQVLFNSTPPPIKPQPPTIIKTKQHKRWPVLVIIFSCAFVILLIGLIFFTTRPTENENKSNSVTSHSNYEEPVREKTPEELRAELKIKEKSNPLDYLSISYSLDFNIFSGNDIINGSISNNATLATFKDAVIDVFFKTETNSTIKKEEYTIYKYFKPNQSTSFKLKVKSPSGTKRIITKIKSAK
jgi:hypothetical protein